MTNTPTNNDSRALDQLVAIRDILRHRGWTITFEHPGYLRLDGGWRAHDVLIDVDGGRFRVGYYRRGTVDDGGTPVEMFTIDPRTFATDADLATFLSTFLHVVIVETVDDAGTAAPRT